MLENNSETKYDGDATDIIQQDTIAVTNETKELIIEAKSSLVILICGILTMSVLCILLSTWLAKTITNTPTSFTTILSRYFGFDHNETERNLTWWAPLHIKSIQTTSQKSVLNITNVTIASIENKVSHDDHPRFHTIALPLFFIGAIIFAVIAYYARIKCTVHGFAWGDVPKIPLGRVDPTAAATAVAAVVKQKEAEPGMDYTIVQGTKNEPVVFVLADTVQPLNEERDVGAFIDEGTQYELQDIPKTMTHVSSAPNFQSNSQTVPSILSPLYERQHMIELLQREPLPTLSPST